MVALSSCTVATRSVSMVARAAWTLLLFAGLVHAHTSPNGKYLNDVTNEEGVIDKLKDLLTSHQHTFRQLAPSPALHQMVNEKIEFAVTPQDERYYRPIAPPSRDAPSDDDDLLHYISPDLSLQPRLKYPGELLQYQDEDVQYPSEYPAQYRPKYHSDERYRPNYLSQQDLQYLGAERLYPGDLQDTRVLGGPDEEGSVEEEDEEDNAREQMKKNLMTEAENYKDDGQLMMKKGTADEDKEETKGVKAATSQHETMNYMHLHRSPADGHVAKYSYQPADQPEQDAHLNDLYFTALVAGCTAVAVCGVVGAGICWYRLNKSHRAAQDAEYPAYGVTGPNKDISPSGDRKLAQSAHMYHYQHQKQQMIALDKSSGGERHGSTSDVDSEEEGEENEYTVYECPGLAPTGEMEVKNPLFHDDPTPATPSVRKEAEEAREHEDKSSK